jgi:hypothetical protein
MSTGTEPPVICWKNIRSQITNKTDFGNFLIYLTEGWGLLDLLTFICPDRLSTLKTETQETKKGKNTKYPYILREFPKTTLTRQMKKIQ